jgi:hypothetical protein
MPPLLEVPETSPPVAPPLPLEPVSLDPLLPCMLLHADSASASMPAKTALWCVYFMIGLLVWCLVAVLVTMPRAPVVRGVSSLCVPVDSDSP